MEKWELVRLVDIVARWLKALKVRRVPKALGGLEARSGLSLDTSGEFPIGSRRLQNQSPAPSLPEGYLDAPGFGLAQGSQFPKGFSTGFGFV